MNRQRALDEVKSRWYNHFTKILSTPSEYHEDMIIGMPSQPTRWDLDSPPTVEELKNIMNKLERGKTGGRSEILPETIACGGGELFNSLYQLIQKEWVEGKVVVDWKDAEIVPIPKKGNLRLWDNWRRISLLDVIGNLFVRLVQERLQIVADTNVLESQCGFWKGRGCVHTTLLPGN